MADGDPPVSTAYVNPYVNPYDKVGNPQAADRYADEHRAAIAQREAQMKDVQGQQDKTVAGMQKLLDETAANIRRARQGNVSMPLLALGAGMMGPGNFGDQVGRGLQAMTGVIGKQREGEVQDEEKIAGLQMQQAKLAMMPLEDRLKYIQALQSGDIAALRAIEQAQIRTTSGEHDPTSVKEWRVWAQQPGNQGKSYDEFLRFKEFVKGKDPNLVKEWQVWQAQPENAGKPLEDYMKFKESLKGQDPAVVKEWKVWKQTPGNENKSLEDYQRVKQSLQARTPADLQYHEQIKKDTGNPNLTFLEAMTMKHEAESFAKASAHELGQIQAKTKAAFPQYEQGVQTTNDLINKMISHPGIDNAVGSVVANLPALPGTPKAAFEAYEAQLKGRVFLEAYEALRGAGAITEAEGLKATVSRLGASRNMDKETYIKELKDYQRRMNLGLEIMRQKAGLPPPENPSPSPPSQTGKTPPPTIIDGPNGPMILKDGQWVPYHG